MKEDRPQLVVHHAVDGYEITAVAEQFVPQGWIASATILKRKADGSVEAEHRVSMPEHSAAATDHAAAGSAISLALKLIARLDS